jgi:HD superfamily phosphohydrolase
VLTLEIRDPIHGNIEISEAEVTVIDTNAYQRLRQIKQLGFAEYSFPGATHNRYLHSLGVCHLTGRAFDSIFRDVSFSTSAARDRLRQAVRMAALLHDIGHGPLSHTTEEVMPRLSELAVDVYETRRKPQPGGGRGQADHEDYTIKFVTDSHLTEALRRSGIAATPIHIACLIDKTLQCPDDFFVDGGVNYRWILSQIVSSELDCDRMD